MELIYPKKMHIYFEKKKNCKQHFKIISFIKHKEELSINDIHIYIYIYMLVDCFYFSFEMKLHKMGMC